MFGCGDPVTCPLSSTQQELLLPPTKSLTLAPPAPESMEKTNTRKSAPVESMVTDVLLAPAWDSSTNPAPPGLVAPPLDPKNPAWPNADAAASSKLVEILV